MAIFSPFSIAKDVNPFTSFFGVWTLKNNEFQQVWDGRTLDTLTIENHLTDCKAVITSKSLLCIVNEGELKGHIWWVYDNDKNKWSIYLIWAVLELEWGRASSIEKVT